MDGSSTKYYCENRKHCRFPWEKRAFVTEHTIMEEVEAAGDHKTKQQLARQTGYTGMSVLSRLYFLYGFNPTTDLVRDVMHVLPMNCGKKIFSDLLSNNDTRLELTDKIKQLQFTSEVSV